MLCYKCKRSFNGERAIEGLHQACFAEWFQLNQIESFKDVSAQTVGNASGELEHINSSFFHGKFKKYSASLGKESYILKVKQPEYPELPATEYLCNQIARFLGLEVPDFFMIRFQGHLDTFVSRNFMANRSSSNLIHFYRFVDKEEGFDCETIMRTLEKRTKNLRDIDRFFELCLFDALIGNHDRHGRNLALIQTPNGLELAPFYDNPSYLATEDDWLLNAHHEPRGKIFTHDSKEPKMRDYVKELNRLGFREIVKRFSEKARLKELNLIVQNGFISEKRKKAIGSLIERRLGELVDGLG